MKDLAVKGPCKRYLKVKYARYEMEEIERRSAAEERGKIVVRIARNQFMRWTENFVDSFNYKERM